MPISINKEVDEELNRFEASIRQLKIQYEQYFGGGRKRPPSDVEWQLEQIMKRYADRGAEMNYTQRFRYGNLVQAYVKYRDIFHKRLQHREEGVVQRHYGAAARAIEVERKRSAKLPPPAAVVVAFTEPAREQEKVDQLYQAFREAQERSGAATHQLSRQNFEWFLRQKAEQFSKQNEGAEVEFVVSLEAGKAHLKARVKS